MHHIIVLHSLVHPFIYHTFTRHTPSICFVQARLDPTARTNNPYLIDLKQHIRHIFYASYILVIGWLGPLPSVIPPSPLGSRLIKQSYSYNVPRTVENGKIIWWGSTVFYSFHPEVTPITMTTICIGKCKSHGENLKCIWETK
jgi:hypothetical protein